MCMHGDRHVCKYIQMPEKFIRFCAAGVTGDCEPLDVNIDHQISRWHRHS